MEGKHWVIKIFLKVRVYNRSQIQWESLEMAFDNADFWEWLWYQSEILILQARITKRENCFKDNDCLEDNEECIGTPYSLKLLWYYDL